MPEELFDLFDLFVSGRIDQANLEALEDCLLHDSETRRHFVRYCRLHTDLHLEARASEAGHRAMHAIDRLERASMPAAVRPASYKLRLWPLAVAAGLLAAVGLGIWLTHGPDVKAQQLEDIAWLINAQDCQWVGNQAPGGDMRAGKVLRLQSGLAEIRFQVGAQVVLQGPAALELLTGNSARLLNGKLTAKVPALAKGFQIDSPHGRIVDLGTEFAVAVGPNGWTDVYVFEGKVEAFAGASQRTSRVPVSVQEKQAVRMNADGVAMKEVEQGQGATEFIRAIVPPQKIVPRILTLDFRQPVPGTLSAVNGKGVGLTHRLPGTGKKLPIKDDNLQLLTDQGQLALKTTNSDINTSFKLDQGEYLGVRLADHGFTGLEDFEVTVVVPNIPELPRVGQFGLYAGLDSKMNIRGGMISSTDEPGQYKQILVQNRDGKDQAPQYLGLTFPPGDDLRMTLRRAAGNYSLTVKNLTTGSSTAITMPEPEFLENEGDFFVGFFGANTQSNERRTLILKEFTVTVWTVAGSAT